jgi:hypothetical protein
MAGPVSTSAPSNRYEIDEKNAIIALQSVLSSRGIIEDEKYAKLAYYLGRLPPYRALLVYGHAMHAISNRLDEDSPYRDALKKLGATITENISPDFPEQVEADPEFFESQRQVLADNLNKISTLMQHFRERSA